jgi:hypothetical protein
MSAITLTVASRNGFNLSSTVQQIFDTEKMLDIQSNLNPQNSVTVTDSGDTANQLSAWALYGIKLQNATYYWSLTLSGSNHTVRVYGNSAMTYILAEGSRTTSTGVVFLTSVGDSTITGEVTINYSAADADSGNTLVVTGVVASHDRQLVGSSQFVYLGDEGERTGYTVSESVAQILALAGGVNTYATTINGKIDCTVTKAIGTYPVKDLAGNDIVIPANSYIQNVGLKVSTTAFTSGGSAELSVGTEGDTDVDNLVNEVAVASLTAGAGAVGVVVLATPSGWLNVTSAKTVQFDVTGDSFTAGIGYVSITYFKI